MDSIIRGTNATIQIKIKEDLDFATITALELHISELNAHFTNNRGLNHSPLHYGDKTH